MFFRSICLIAFFNVVFSLLSFSHLSTSFIYTVSLLASVQCNGLIVISNSFNPFMNILEIPSTNPNLPVCSKSATDNFNESINCVIVKASLHFSFKNTFKLN